MSSNNTQQGIAELPKEGTYVQGCQFDYHCKQTGDYGTSQEPTNHCRHNGGVDCPIWRRLTDVAIGWNVPLPNRSWSNIRK